MKTILLAGGLGSRLAEETVAIPKPMVEVGGRPIIARVMDIYCHFGHTDFVPGWLDAWARCLDDGDLPQ